MEPQIGLNTGVLYAPPKPTDFIAGAETGILEEVRNPDALWTVYVPPGEPQKLLTTDTMACVSFSANDAMEILGDFCVSRGTWSAENIQWLRDNGYFNSDGTLNFSDRFVAKISGTTKEGNYFTTVWDAIRHKGLVPESSWPAPLAEIAANPGNTWNIYYADIPDSVLALGQEFLKRFQIQYEWVILPGTVKTPDTIRQMLTIAPLQIGTLVCNGWSTQNPVMGCGMGCQHATALFSADDAKYSILDHYQPYVKNLASNYDITYGMRGVISEVVPPSPIPATHVFNQNLAYGMGATDEVHALQAALQKLGYMRVGLFGPYGPQTQAAVAAFQKANGIVDAPMGSHVGPQTRAKLNQLTK